MRVLLTTTINANTCDEIKLNIQSTNCSKLTLTENPTTMQPRAADEPLYVLRELPPKPRGTGTRQDLPKFTDLVTAQIALMNKENEGLGKKVIMKKPKMVKQRDT
jgi:hypothetical protein